MAVFRYKAIPLAGGTATAGERSADSEAELRSALRSVGLQVIDVRERRGGKASTSPVGQALAGYARSRRSVPRAEFFDSLATLLRSGVPLTQALETIAAPGTAPVLRRLTTDLGESVRSGKSLSEAAAAKPSWFDRPMVSLLRAGEHAGELERVLSILADRQAREGAISQKLIGALAYPTLVLLVGVGVTVFLGTRTLPELATMLEGSDVSVPALTSAVMSVAAWMVTVGPLVLVGVVVAVLAGVTAAATQRDAVLPQRFVCLVPPLLRRLAVAKVAAGVADLSRCGVPLVEAVKVTVPTVHGFGTSRLRQILRDLGKRLEAGEGVGDVFDDPLWFDGEFRRLVVLGQASGELPAVLSRLADRMERRSRRSIDRLAAFIEPAAVLALAVLVGIVVMAAVLPLIRLQEVL